MFEQITPLIGSYDGGEEDGCDCGEEELEYEEHRKKTLECIDAWSDMDIYKNNTIDLRKDFVRLSGGHIKAPYMDRSLVGLMHGIMRIDEKILRLIALFTIAVTGSDLKAVDAAAKCRGLRIRLKQHHHYKDPHVEASIVGGTCGDAVHKLSKGAEEIVKPIAKTEEKIAAKASARAHAKAKQQWPSRRWQRQR